MIVVGVVTFNNANNSLITQMNHQLIEHISSDEWDARIRCTSPESVPHAGPADFYWDRIASPQVRSDRMRIIVGFWYHRFVTSVRFLFYPHPSALTSLLVEVVHRVCGGLQATRGNDERRWQGWLPVALSPGRLPNMRSWWSPERCLASAPLSPSYSIP